jgi:TrmH family RNA methyltransferase
MGVSSGSRNPLISSLQNPRVRAAAQLRDSRQRQKQGRMLIDGARELGRAVASGVRPAEIFLCRELLAPSDVPVAEQLTQCGAEILEVTPRVFERLAFGGRTEGVLGVAPTPAPTLDGLCLPALPLVAVLEGVEKPGNVGAVLRSADAAGVSALVVADPRTDLYNPNTIRASLGTVFSLPVAAASSAEVIAWLGRQGLAIYAARVDGSIPYTQADFRRPAAIVLGSEAEGLTAAWSGTQVTAIRLPMLGRADSLNVSVTAAVLFYEALRQRA